MDPIKIRYLSGHDVAALELGNDEIPAAVESGLRAPFERDRALSADIETILEQFSSDAFTSLCR